MKKLSKHIIVINKQTELGEKKFVQGSIHGIVSTLVRITDGVKPQDVFAEPDVNSKSYLTMHVECSNEAYGLIIEHVNEHYPNVCLFEMY